VRITVIGAGPLGCAHAAGLAELGFDILGIDLDKARVETLNAGRAPIFDPGLPELLAQHVAGVPGSTNRLRFTTSLDEVATFGDVHVVCVGTPQHDADGAADMRQVDGAITDLVPRLHGRHLVVLKSTVPVGTSARLIPMIDGLVADDAEVGYAFNPEFLREGHSVHDVLHPDRIVVGTGDGSHTGAVDVLARMYAAPLAEGAPWIVTDFATAELVKGAANAFLATKVSFVNAMAEVCDASGADVSVLADAIGHDARIGRAMLNAGLGYGGGCLPKDLRALMARAGELGASDVPSLLREVDAINIRRRARVVEMARDLLGGSVAGSRVAVLGAAFKPESDDVRDSPALDVAGQLFLHGARVRVYDPQAGKTARAAWPTLEYADSVDDACAEADLVLLGTEWRVFRELDPAALLGVVAAPVVLDARNALDPHAWRGAGWTYRGIGRP